MRGFEPGGDGRRRVIDATSPPLLATPGGVTSSHRDDPSGTVNSCQKVFDRVVEVAHGHDGPRPPGVADRLGQGDLRRRWRRSARPGGRPDADEQATARSRSARSRRERHRSGGRSRRGGPTALPPPACSTTHDWAVCTWPTSSAENEDRLAGPDAPGSALRIARVSARPVDDVHDVGVGDHGAGGSHRGLHPVVVPHLVELGHRPGEEHPVGQVLEPFLLSNAVVTAVVS